MLKKSIVYNRFGVSSVEITNTILIHSVIRTFLLHRHRLRHDHGIATLLQTRRDELLAKPIKTATALVQAVKDIHSSESFLDNPLLRCLLQDFASQSDD